MFTSTRINDVAAVAKANNIPVAAFLAVIEVESNGAPFEPDGITPRFLFERHVFNRQLRSQPAKQKSALKQGVSSQSYNKKNYADQGSGSGRRALLDAALRIDEEAAYSSASWGVGQIMGFHAKSMGYNSATSMVKSMSSNADGERGQIEVMARFIMANNLVRFLRSRDWASFAYRYNGEAYKTNRYDTKLAKAYAYWSTRQLPSPNGTSSDAEPELAVSILKRGSRGPNVIALQKRLSELGYSLGAVDGEFGPATESAVFQFQSQNGLRADGIAGPQTLAALPAGKPMEVSEQRREATASNLLKLGSPIIKETNTGEKVAAGVTAAGALGLLQSFLTTTATQDVIKTASDSAPADIFGTGLLGDIGRMVATVAGGDTSALSPIIKMIPTVLGPGHGLPLLAAGLGIALYRSFGKVAAARVKEHADAQHRGR